MSIKPIAKKVIIIDDDSNVRKMYGSKFSQDPHLEILTAANGEEGLIAIREHNPSLILLDIMMPQKDGFDVLTKIKKDKNLRNIPIVMLTNLANVEDKKQSFKKGALDYLVKVEHTPSEVLERVKKILQI